MCVLAWGQMSYNMDSSNVSQLRFVSPPLDRPFDGGQQQPTPH